MEVVLGRLSNGDWVNDRHVSHIHADAKDYVAKALSQINPKGRRYFTEAVNFGHVIDSTVCVETGPEDEIVWAKRPGKPGYSRFVKKRKPIPCSGLTVLLKKAEECYICISAFIGQKPEPEPWDNRNFEQTANSHKAKEKSLEFWANHAFVWCSKPIIKSTVTTKYPW